MYRKIINNGIPLISNINEAKRIQLLRIYCVIWAHISLTFITLDQIFKPPFKNIDTLLHSCCLISIGIIFLLLYFKKYFVAKIFLIIQCFGMFSSITFILLEATYSIFYFTLIPIVALSLFKKNTIAYATLILGICIAIFHKETPEALSDASIHVNLFKAPIMITMFFGLFAIFSYFKELNLKNEKLLAIERDNALSDKIILEKQETELRELNNFKTHFFVNLSHEIRTPITLIKGYTSNINLKDAVIINEDKLEIVDTQIQHIEAILNNILDLSKLDANKLILERHDIEIIPFLNKHYADFKALFNKKNINFNLNTNIHNIKVNMDNNLITKSINNLLSNALKFTPKNGAVNINLYFNDFLEVEIVDNGIGIPKEDIHKIFDRFYQSKNDITKSQGSGIGLSFTKSIIETHGFSISVQSIPKVKTTFKISIPKQFISQINNNTQEVIPKTDNEIIDIKSNKQKTILIVDDHKQLRDYLKSILKDYSFIEAENGKEALNIIKNKRIDLLLTDYMMPVMNGETLVKEVKKQNLKIPIIMLTARVDDFAKLKMLRVGVDGYLNKPFVEEELLLTVKNSLKLYTTIVNTQKTLTLIEKEDLHTKGQEFNEKIVSFILVNIHKTDFSVQDIAKHLNISQSTLNRRTKSIFGQTAQQFILQVKLEEAKKLVIQNPNLSKKEIGYKVGILNTSYLFKKLEERFYKKNIDN